MHDDNTMWIIGLSFMIFTISLKGVTAEEGKFNLKKAGMVRIPVYKH